MTLSGIITEMPEAHTESRTVASDGDIIGIDPGLSGAIAMLSDGKVFKVHDIPTVPIKKNKREVNYHELVAILRSWPSKTVWLEHVSAMPGQGVTSMFNFGQTYGAIKAACVAAGHELRFVTPAKWKKHFGLTKEKGVARQKAMQRVPGLADQFKRVKDDGRAEATLIAIYGAEVRNG